uniref:Uncharacterized protein n=1 Tax=Octopus bimaculoides TaxID=37653 RepID=A0A0L8H2X7_OCTBM
MFDLNFKISSNRSHTHTFMCSSLSAKHKKCTQYMQSSTCPSNLMFCFIQPRLYTISSGSQHIDK